MKSYVFWFALSVLGLVIIHATVRLAELPTYAEFAAVSVRACGIGPVCQMVLMIQQRVG
jgi:hypothetical protein